MSARGSSPIGWLSRLSVSTHWQAKAGRRQARWAADFAVQLLESRTRKEGDAERGTLELTV